MKTELKCISCLVRNTVNIAEMMTDDDRIREQIVKKMVREIAEFDCRKSPPMMARRIYSYASEQTGISDPYREHKDLSTRLAKDLLERFRAESRYDFDHFETLVRLAIGGNIIDFGVDCNLDLQYAQEMIRSAFQKEIDGNALQTAKKAMESAENILYLLDNCGEAVFDTLLVRKFADKITLSVKGTPVLNDVTRREIEDSGFVGFPARIVDTGDCTPGVSLEHASPEFLDAFRKADLIVSKGQGNFETLYGCGKNVIFLFMAKCEIVAKFLNVQKNSFQIICTHSDSEFP